MKMKDLSIGLIFLMGSVAISGCDKFPVSKIYIKENNSCAEVEILKDNPLEFGNAKKIELSECPSVVYGFKEEDVATVTDWIRRQQKKGN